MSAKFIANVILKGKIECLTGLHIGGSKEKFEIGGVDSPVLRDPNTNYPYIPGSSLKGKMRSVLSFALEKADVDLSNDMEFNPECPLQRVFGVPANLAERGIGPTRLIVRDSYPDEETLEMWKNLDSELLYTEFKPENSINRLTATANPRFLERVVKGSFFNVELIFGIYDVDDVKDEEYVKDFIEALRLLEHSTLGGSGSRGYGQIAFKFIKPILLMRNDYELGGQTFKDSLKSIDELKKDEKYNWHMRLSDFDDNFIKEEIIEKIKRQ